MAGVRLNPTARACGLAFVTAAVTLFVQVLVHRMVSAKLMNNYAFLVISLSMLGFAFSGVLLSVWLDRLLGRFEDTVAMCAALFVASLLGASALFYHMDPGHQFASFGRDFLLHLGRWVPLTLPYAVPFVFCGLILGLVLSDARVPTGRVYFCDLIGSAAGAFFVIFAIRALGVERSLLAACGVMLLGALALAPPHGALAKGLAAAAALGLVATAAGESRVFAMRYPEASPLWQVERLPKPYGIEYVAWDPVTRIEVSRIEPPDPTKAYTPSLTGDDPAFLRRFERMLTQNNGAFTFAIDYDGRPETLRGTADTVYASAYQASSVAHPRVLVIGVGGGFDVLTALNFDPSEVVGVEVNAATVDILTRVYRDYFRRWVDDPRFRLVTAEGRQYLAREPARYDVLQLSGVDSYSGTPGAAHVFSESYLYTAEAFDLYLRRLGPSGILNVMRVEYTIPRDMLRVLVTAVGALRRAGAQHPADHVVLLREITGHYVAVLVKKTPFTAAELGHVAGWAAQNRYLKLAGAPGMNAPDGNMYQRFLSLDNPAREAAFVAGYPFNVQPATDDRPFFFNYSFWWHTVTRDPILQQYSQPVMEYTLMTLLAVVCVSALFCVYLPLRTLASRGRKVAGAARYGSFFALIGLGYLAIEVALLQKFGLFLGHPNYAVSVVLASLLLTTGIGSLLSPFVPARVGPLRFMSYALAGLILLEYRFLLPELPGLIPLTLGTRVLLVFVFIAPIGLCLGAFFPTGLERLKPTAAAFVPWAWGINGIFSVLAPVLAVGVSMTWGIDALLISAIPFYLAAGLVLPDANAQVVASDATLVASPAPS